MLTPRERFHTDANFRALVNMAYNFIQQCQFTPTELREAVMLAAIIHAERNPMPPLHLEKDITNWLDGKA